MLSDKRCCQMQQGKHAWGGSSCPGNYGWLPRVQCQQVCYGAAVWHRNVGANPARLNFGSVQTGTNLPLSQSVTNSGNSSVTISQVGISGTSFTLSGITPPVTLAAGQSASFTVTFAPTSATSASGSLTVTSNGSNPTLTISLAGTGSAT